MERVRTSERIDFQRCPTKWYYRWRMGLTPKEIKFDAPWLGTVWHEALPAWYGKGTKRHGTLATRFYEVANAALSAAEDAGANQATMEVGEELANLGLDMSAAYEAHYGQDENWSVIDAEIPLEFHFKGVGQAPATAHYLKPDALIQEVDSGLYWLVENKTAARIETLHLPLDPQSTSYAVMSERALKRAGYDITIKGIIYNFARKVLSDQRERNAQGYYLNQNGTVSKRQPSPQFVRHKEVLTRPAKRLALERTMWETMQVAGTAQLIRNRRMTLDSLPMHRGKACPKCPYFKLCVLHEQGGDTKGLQRAAYTKQDPYTYGESTDEIAGWEW